MPTKSLSQLSTAGTLLATALIDVAQLSTTVVMTATTLSADGDDNSYNDSAAQFVAEGFTVGNRVKVQGFTGNVVNNIFVGVVTALTTTKMTIGGTDGNVIVDDAAGESVIITKWESRRSTVQDIIDLLTSGLSVVATDADDYTVAAADNNKYIRLTAAGTKTITVPTEAVGGILPTNGEWNFRNHGAGDATISASGVTVNLPTGGSLVIPQGGTVTLKRIATNAFDLIGVTSP